MMLILWSPFTASMGERERCYSFILSRTPHERTFKELYSLQTILIYILFLIKGAILWFTKLTNISKEEDSLRISVKFSFSYETSYSRTQEACFLAFTNNDEF
jgi:hypothetical protein